MNVAAPDSTGGQTQAPKLHVVQGSEPATATAASAHDMFIAIAVLAVFVYVMVLVAGTSKTAGRTVVLMFAALLLLQGMTHVNPFLQWMVAHPLQPKRVNP